MTYVTDTHGLIWYLTGQETLPEDSAAIYRAAEAGNTTVLVPTIVGAELVDLCEKGRASMDAHAVLQSIRATHSFPFFDLNYGVVEEIIEHDIPELHDRIIAATATLTDATVITKDTDLVDSDIPTIWHAS